MKRKLLIILFPILIAALLSSVVMPLSAMAQSAARQVVNSGINADLSTDLVERISVDSSGQEGNGASGFAYPPSISADGRYVAFSSTASNLVSGDTNGAEDVFVRDRQLGTT